MAWIPITPAGTPLVNLSARTEAVAWEALMGEGAHMPYPDKAAWIERGYTVEHWPGWQAEIRRKWTRSSLS